MATDVADRINIGVGSEAEILQLARAADARQDWGAAEGLWRECLERFEAKVRANWYGGLARALRKLDRSSEADAVYEIMRERWPRIPTGWVGAAQCAAARKDWEAAERLLRECIAQFGTNIDVDIFSQLAIALMQQNRLEEALTVCRTAQDRFPTLPSGLAAEAKIAAARGAWRSSGQILERAAEKATPDSASGFLHKGFKAFLRSGRFGDAARLLAQLKTREPHEIRWLSAGFELFNAQGDAHGALAYLGEQANHPMFHEAFTGEQLAAAAFEIGLPPVEAIECLLRWMSPGEAAGAVDKIYGVGAASFEEISSAVENIRNRTPASSYSQRLLVSRTWARRFLRNRTYKIFSSDLNAAFSIANDRQISTLRSIAVKYFPASRLRARFDQYTQRTAVEQHALAFASGWRTRLPQPGNSIADQLRGIQRHRLVCATVVRDEAEMLAHFVPYYMNLGIQNFIIVDNGSVDGLDNLRDGVSGANMIVVDAPYNFARNRHGMTWINEILEAGICDWLLYVDADEQLIFPGYESRKLPSLLDHLEGRGETAMPAFMLDVYDEGYKANVNPSEDIRKHDTFYAQYSVFNTLRASYKEVVGGIRFTDYKPNILEKTPLVRASAGVRMFDNHRVNICNPSQTTGILLHYKIFRDRKLMSQAPEAIAAHSRVRDRGVREIVRHIELSGRAEEFRASGPFHVRLTGTRQLLALGYFSSDEDWQKSFGGPPSRNREAEVESPVKRSSPAVLPATLQNTLAGQPGIEQLLEALEALAELGQRQAVRALLRRTFLRIESQAAKLAILLFAAGLFSAKTVEDRLARKLVETISSVNSIESIKYVSPIISTMVDQNKGVALTVLDAIQGAGLLNPVLSLARAKSLISLDRWPEAQREMTRFAQGQQKDGRALNLLILKHRRRWSEYHDELAEIIRDERHDVNGGLLHHIGKFPDAACRQRMLESLKCRLEPALPDLNATEASVYLSVLYNLGLTKVIAEKYGQLRDRLTNKAKMFFSRYLETVRFPSAYRNHSVWCLGMSKTGTSSLHAYAQKLGLLSAHFVNPLTGGLLDTDDADLFDMVSDSSVVYFAMRDGVDPGRKLIVTTRNFDDWENSFLVHFKREFGGEAETYAKIREIFYDEKLFAHGRGWFDIHYEIYFKHETARAAYDCHFDWINTLERRMDVPILRLPLESEAKADMVSGYLGSRFPVLEYPTKNLRVEIT